MYNCFTIEDLYVKVSLRHRVSARKPLHSSLQVYNVKEKIEFDIDFAIAIEIFFYSQSILRLRRI